MVHERALIDDDVCAVIESSIIRNAVTGGVRGGYPNLIGFCSPRAPICDLTLQGRDLQRYVQDREGYPSKA